MSRDRARLLLRLVVLQLLAPVPMVGDGLVRELGAPHPVVRAARHAHAWVASAHTPCDAEALAAAWGTSSTAARLHIGRRVAEGDLDRLDDELIRARIDALDAGSRCYLDERPIFSATDLDALAAHWSMSLEETAALVAYKLGQGNEHLVAFDLRVLHEVREGIPLVHAHRDDDVP